MANVLVCDDERSIRELLEIALRKEGHKVETVNSGELAIRKIEAARYDVIVTDIKMPNIDGIEVLKHAHRISPASAVVLITAAGDFDSAVQAVKSGAFDYIQKTPNALVDEVRVSIGRAAEVIFAVKIRLFGGTRQAGTRLITSSAAVLPSSYSKKPFVQSPQLAARF
jgi:DNA-binding NtrC family response regulator